MENFSPYSIAENTLFFEIILIFLCLFLPSLKATISQMYVIGSPGIEFLPIISNQHQID
jgi:hypothetical protein